MKSVAAAFMTVRDANQIDGMPMSLDSSKVRFTLCGNTIDALPRCTGIYRFLGEQDQLLYIGKSVNIYSRVRSHFARSGQGDRQRRMIHATRTVDCRPTAGEAGALLLENAAIKQEMPLFNRRQRRLRSIWSIVIEQGKHGFLEPRVRFFPLRTLTFAPPMACFPTAAPRRKPCWSWRALRVCVPSGLRWRVDGDRASSSSLDVAEAHASTANPLKSTIPGC